MVSSMSFSSNRRLPKLACDLTNLNKFTRILSPRTSVYLVSGPYTKNTCIGCNNNQEDEKCKEDCQPLHNKKGRLSPAQTLGCLFDFHLPSCFPCFPDGGDDRNK